MSVWEQTYPFEPGGEVIVEQRSGGSIQVAGWERPEVLVRAVTAGEGPAEERLAVEPSFRRLTVMVQDRGWRFWGGRDDRLDLEVTVPHGTRCSVEAGSGPVAVRDTRGVVELDAGSGPVSMEGVRTATIDTGSGEVRLSRVDGGANVDTGSGNVLLEQVRGNVRIDVGSGNVDVREVSGSLRVETGSGRIGVAAVEGQVELESGSGRIEVRHVRGDRLTVETSGGGARLTGIDVSYLELESGSGGAEVEFAGVRKGGVYRVEAGSGGVLLTVPPQAELTMDLECGSGRIEHEGLPINKVWGDSCREMQAVLNGGGARLQVEAGSGSIKLMPGAATPEEAVSVTRPLTEPEPAPAASPEADVVETSGLEQVLRSDPALEHSDQVRRVLQMVEDGRLTPEEAEAILRALDEEEAGGA